MSLEECCMSGCAICVHDLYAESLEAYDQAVSTLHESLKAKGIDESTWPAQIRDSKPKATTPKEKVLSAFEKFELELARKQEEAQMGKEQKSAGG